MKTLTNHGYGLEKEAMRLIKEGPKWQPAKQNGHFVRAYICLLYTSDAADERSSVDLGGRRIIKKKKKDKH